MIIKYYIKNIYGREHRFCADKHIEAILRDLTGFKTITDRVKALLEQLDITFVEIKKTESIGFIISLDKVKAGEMASSMDGFVFDSLEKAKNVKEDLKDEVDRPLYIYKVNFTYPNNDNHLGDKEIKVTDTYKY